MMKAARWAVHNRGQFFEGSNIFFNGRGCYHGVSMDAHAFRPGNYLIRYIAMGHEAPGFNALVSRFAKIRWDTRISLTGSMVAASSFTNG
jgi:hypothetical protein